MFGDKVAGKSRKYLASQTFTASYPGLQMESRLGSIALWALVLGCKDAESYFFFMMAIMYVMDLVSVFLDTFLWYIIWNTAFSIARSFILGSSIWNAMEERLH
jgi:1,3-beta-glucan synthase